MVGDQGIVNIKCNGIPSFSAQWMCPKLGGFAMMASAMNGLLAEPPLTLMLGAYDVPSPGSTPELCELCELATCEKKRPREGYQLATDRLSSTPKVYPTSLFSVL